MVIPYSRKVGKVHNQLGTLRHFGQVRVGVVRFFAT